MDQNFCVLCNKAKASLGAGMNILCKECLLYEYNSCCKQTKIFACKNIKCEGKLIPNCRFNTVLASRQPSYNITPLGKVYVHSLCPYCEIFMGIGTQYYKSVRRKKSISSSSNMRHTYRADDLIKREKSLISPIPITNKNRAHIEELYAALVATQDKK